MRGDSVNRGAAEGCVQGDERRREGGGEKEKERCGGGMQ